MQENTQLSAHQIARSKLQEWLGDGWMPDMGGSEKVGFHGTRKHLAEEIVEKGFQVPERKIDGSAKRRKLGPGVYLFVETERALGTKVTGVEAATRYACHQRGWKDPGVVRAPLPGLKVLDRDTWPHWQTLQEKMKAAFEADKDTLSPEELRAGYELVVTHSVKLLEDALAAPVEAILSWAEDMPCPNQKGYHCLAVRPPHEARLTGLEAVNPSL